MKSVKEVNEIINNSLLSPGRRIYCSGNAATPQAFLRQMASDQSITDVELLSVLLLGDVGSVFDEDVCRRITHRVIFNSHHSRGAVNKGLAKYQLIHLSDIPRQVKEFLKPDVVLVSVSGPDNGGNYSLGTTVEGVMAAIHSAKAQNGLVIAERNDRMPFILGTTVPEEVIDYIVDVDYDLPVSPVKKPDELADRIANLIAHLYIEDGSTIQYGIGEVPEAVTRAIIDKGVKDLGIRTELFADAMRTLVEKGIVTNRYLNNPFSIASIFLSGNRGGYNWMDFNSSIQSRPSDKTNSILNIARHPKMIAINSAIGVDLHGNIWADSLDARKIYSGVGGQADFLRGAYLSEGGVPIIAMKSSTDNGLSKIQDKCPEGITTTAIAADPVIIVTEYGAFDPRGLSITEHAVGIAHLAAPEARENLLRHIYDSGQFHNPSQYLRNGIPKGFFPYENFVGMSLK
ncbi:Acetyl-CoA hydrolase/transferase [Desulfamplus magnetovallimortis]|uniref:Acetyl-CoA hydrolase/transferase n=1 Tax=Desulfamplus magnetovallimortis TaxID=1246637 RepID=A0A1W1HBF0_9BACT|nr:acetyl-CoA hydrolase/transferase C-terminal domain-containing protein [Desulfamplus magnetovallimortis]SLM29766.1 Acetyl-CoA hydrolase/transferase [Desulfamplus magnetovallimortis]